MHVSLFLCCDLSFWHCTTILVGIQKIAPKKFSAKADGSLRVGGINKWSSKSGY